MAYNCLYLFLYSAIAYGQEVCPIDQFEDNDNISSAKAIGAGNYVDLQVCEDDADYFLFTLPDGDNLQAAIEFVHTAGDIDLFLYDPNGIEVASSTTLSDTESFDYHAIQGGDYIILVDLYEDDAAALGNRYSLSTSTYTMTPCIPDAEEPNETLEQAASLSSDSSLELSMCRDDIDWFAISLQEAEQLTATIQFQHIEGDIDLFLFDSAGSLLTSALSTDDSEVLQYNPPRTGTYYLKAGLLADTGLDIGNSYVLTVETEQLPVCVADDWEPNNDREAASQLEDESFSGLTLCDDDWYAMSVEKGDQLTVTLKFSHAEGDIDASLYDPNGQLIVTSSSVLDEESVSAIADQSGLYSWHVLLRTDQGSTGSSYDMQVTYDVFEEEEEEVVDEVTDTAQPASTEDPVDEVSKEVEKKGCMVVSYQLTTVLFLWLPLFGLVYTRRTR